MTTDNRAGPKVPATPMIPAKTSWRQLKPDCLHVLQSAWVMALFGVGATVTAVKGPTITGIYQEKPFTLDYRLDWSCVDALRAIGACTPKQPVLGILEGQKGMGKAA